MVGKTGGLRKGSGIGKQGCYKGYYYNSAWELAWIIYNIDHNIPFERNTEGFEYTFEYKPHKFYPDFILSNKEYVEIKGYSSKQFEQKKQQFPHTLTVIGKSEITPFLRYVEENYGKEILKK